MLRRDRTVAVWCVTAGALLCGWADAPSACTLCIGFPEKTATDHILEADYVVLGRPTARDPYSYARGERLKGGDPGGRINLLVDTRTRRLLAAEPDRHVVLTHNKTDGGWRSLGIASDNYLSTFRRVAVLGAAWEGTGGAERRWRFFLPLFGHEDPSIRELAYLEMGRAPYPVLRQLGQVAPRETYAPLLEDPKYLKWRSLAILLLAQSDDPSDRRLVRSSYASAKRLRMTTNLAAWAAALIELDSESAVSEIEAAYLRSPQRSAEEVDAVVQALSMHGRAADAVSRDRIVVSYRLLLKNHPRYAARVAADLDDWDRSELAQELSASLARYPAFDVAEKTGIQRYLRAAAAAGELGLFND